jgi:DNA-binding GntR family transcriptional regulator
MTFDDAPSAPGSLSGGARHAHTGQWVAGALRSRISEGDLPPGTKLLEEALCSALGVSRNTLREAFAILAGENIVTRVPNRGVFVARPTAEDIGEIYRVRRYLEPAALRWGDGAHAAGSVLDAVIARGRYARDAGDAAAMAGANQDFHKAVVALAGSVRFDAMMSEVLAEMRLVFHGMGNDPVFHAPYVEANADIARMLRGGRVEEAAESMRAYLDQAEAQLLSAMHHH